MLRYGGRILKREPEQITALFGLGEPDGRDTELATRCALVALRALDGPRQPSAGVHTARIHVSAQGEPRRTNDSSRSWRRRAIWRGRAKGACAISAVALRQVKRLFGVEPLERRRRPARPRRSCSTCAGRRDLRSLRRAEGRAPDGRRGARRGHEAQGAHAHDPRRPRRGQDAAPLRGRAAPPEGELQRRLARGDLSAARARVPALGHRRDAPGPLRHRRGRLPRARDDGRAAPARARPARRGGRRDPARRSARTCRTSRGTRRASCASRSRASSRASAKTARTRSRGTRRTAWTRTASSSSRMRGSGSPTCASSSSSPRAPGSRTRSRSSARTPRSICSTSKPEDAERLIAVQLGIDRAPDELVRFVRDRAGGHPQFIEEVLKALVDAQAVTVAEGQVVAMKLVGQDLALPKTLRGLVASRVARLASSERATLQAAAVLGDPVDVAVLAQMLDQPMGALEALARRARRPTSFSRTSARPRSASLRPSYARSSSTRSPTTRRATCTRPRDTRSSSPPGPRRPSSLRASRTTSTRRATASARPATSRGAARDASRAGSSRGPRRISPGPSSSSTPRRMRPRNSPTGSRSSRRPCGSSGRRPRPSRCATR